MTATDAKSEEDQEKRFVLGKGRYVDDIKLEGMLHMHFVRSPYARARILSVSGGINGHELKADMAAVGEESGERGTIRFPALAAEYVNYVGQPIAAVLGEDRYQAEDRVDEVDVQYEPLKPVMDPERSLTSEPIHPNSTSNLAAEGTVGKDFKPNAPVEVEETFRMARVTPNPLETRGVVAVYDGSVLTVYGSTQSVFSWKEGFLESMHLKEDMVRVVQMDTGGAFGSKGGIFPEYVAAAYAAMKLRRPVKWVESRYEHLMATDQGRGGRGKMKVYAVRSGRIRGLKGDILVDTGAYPTEGSWSTGWIGFQLTGPYSIPRAYVTSKIVMTNRVTRGPYRGAGRPEAAFFMERIMDSLADELGMDQAKIRLVNAASKKWTSPTGLSIAPSRPFLKEALRAFNYSGKKKKEALGLSWFVLVPAAYSGESGKVAVSGGRVQVWLGGSSHGQGHDVFVRQLVGKELGVKEDLVDFHLGDTSSLSSGVGSWGSRTAMMGGAAAFEASRKLKSMAKKKLGRSYSTTRLLEGDYEAEVFFKPEGGMNSFGANLVAARVNGDGIGAIEEVVSYYDVGRALNPVMIESQIIGGSAQAVGEVLYEGALYGEDGQLLTATLADSGVPHSTEMPRFVVKTASHPSSLPHGAKGVGESPAIGVPPAATRALEQILGKKFTSLPIPSEQLWVSPPG